jgi:glutathione-independent formaldehyde dehydrogenase
MYEGRTSVEENKILGHENMVKRCNRELRDLIIAGRAAPSFLVSHELPLMEAPTGYENFDKRVDGWTKVVLHP